MATTDTRYRVYTIVEREADVPFWLNIGLAFPHKDGLGFNVKLQALPLQGRLVLRTFEEDPRTVAAIKPEAETEEVREQAWAG